MKRDPIGREILSPLPERPDWVMVRDPDGVISYIPSTYLADNKQPYMTVFSYMSSLIYLLPIIQYFDKMI